MTALVFVTQAIDERDAVLGFVPGLVRALASRIDRVTVIANAVSRPLPDLPGNVRIESLGRERGAGRTSRGLRYERLLLHEARAGRVDALLAHMCPEYLSLAAPVATIFRFPTILWFAHPARSRALTIANAAASAVLTSLPGAYPLPSAKVRVVGQATDTAGWAPCPWKGPGRPLRVVAIGRTSPAKGFEVVVRAAAIARARGVSAEVRIIGPSLTPEEHRHRRRLTALVADLGLGSSVRIEPAVGREGVRDAICAADVLVNAMVAGSGDKVVFEAASLGRPVLVSNPSFAGFLRDLPLELSFREADADALADRLGALAAADRSTLRRATEVLRSRVSAEHSLERWADSVAGVVTELTERRARS